MGLWLSLWASLVLVLIWDLYGRTSVSKRAMTTLGLSIVLFICYGTYFLYDSGFSSLKEYVIVYLVELSLSIDNLFIFSVIFARYAIEGKYQQKLLTIGIISAVVLRAVFIVFGIELVQHFSWVNYFLGAILLWTAWRILQHTKPEPLQFSWLPITHKPHNGKFIIKHNGHWYVTSLCVALVAIEGTDLLFALDSIPASLAITTNMPILIVANILAIIGLRSLFFFVQKGLKMLHYLDYSLSAILLFIGIKIIIHPFFTIPSGYALLVVLTLMGIGAVASYVRDKPQA